MSHPWQVFTFCILVIDMLWIFRLGSIAARHEEYIARATACWKVPPA